MLCLADSEPYGIVRKVDTPLMGGAGPGNGLFKIFALAAVDGIAADANRIARKPMADLRAIVGNVCA